MQFLVLQTPLLSFFLPDSERDIASERSVQRVLPLVTRFAYLYLLLSVDRAYVSRFFRMTFLARDFHTLGHHPAINHVSR